MEELSEDTLRVVTPAQHDTLIALTNLDSCSKVFLKDNLQSIQLTFHTTAYDKRGMKRGTLNNEDGVDESHVKDIKKGYKNSNSY